MATSGDLFEFGDYVGDIGNGMYLMGVGGVKILYQWVLIQFFENGEVIYVVIGCGYVGMVVFVDQYGGVVVGVEHFVDVLVFVEQKLCVEVGLGIEVEVVDFVMMGFVWQVIGIVFVRRETGSTAGADGQQFADQQPPDAPGRFFAQNMLNLAVSLGLIRAVLQD